MLRTIQSSIQLSLCILLMFMLGQSASGKFVDTSSKFASGDFFESDRDWLEKKPAALEAHQEILWIEFRVVSGVILYSYCHNDPINKVDVLGLAEFPLHGSKVEKMAWLSQGLEKQNIKMNQAYEELLGSSYFDEHELFFMLKKGHIARAMQREVGGVYDTNRYSAEELVSAYQTVNIFFKASTVQNYYAGLTGTQISQDWMYDVHLNAGVDLWSSASYIANRDYYISVQALIGKLVVEEAVMAPIGGGLGKLFGASVKKILSNRLAKITGETLKRGHRFIQNSDGAIAVLYNGSSKKLLKLNESLYRAPKTTPKFEIVPYSGQPTPTSWPGNRGFLGSSNKVTLEPGSIVDRYGFRNGTFVSPRGTPFPMRALPDSTLSKPFEAYRVRSALEVDGGLITPAFGKPGLGTQFELPHSVDELIQLKILEPIK